MDDYEPREHDHLIEPFFGGLGDRDGPGDRGGPGDGPAPRPREDEELVEEVREEREARGEGLLVRVVRVLSIFRRRDPSEG